MDVSVDSLRLIYHREGLNGILSFHIFPVMEMFIKFQVPKSRMNDRVIRPIGLDDYSILAIGQTFQLEHFLEQLFYNWKTSFKMRITTFGDKSYSIPMLPLYAGKNHLTENHILNWYYQRYKGLKPLIVAAPIRRDAALAPLSGTVYAIDERSADSDDEVLPPSDLFYDYGQMNLEGGVYDAAVDGPLIGTLPLGPAESIGSVISSETRRPLTPLTMEQLREQVMKDPLLQPSCSKEEEERLKSITRARNAFDPYLAQVLEGSPEWLKTIKKVAIAGDYTPEFNLLLASVPIPLDASGRAVAQDELRRTSEFYRKEYLRLRQVRDDTRSISSRGSTTNSLFSEDDKAFGYSSILSESSEEVKRAQSTSASSTPRFSHVSRIDSCFPTSVTRTTLKRKKRKNDVEGIELEEIVRDKSDKEDVRDIKGNNP